MGVLLICVAATVICTVILVASISAAVRRHAKRRLSKIAEVRIFQERYVYPRFGSEDQYL